jgi:hypothetical protein
MAAWTEGARKARRAGGDVGLGQAGAGRDLGQRGTVAQTRHPGVSADESRDEDWIRLGLRGAGDEAQLHPAAAQGEGGDDGEERRREVGGWGAERCSQRACVDQQAQLARTHLSRSHQTAQQIVTLRRVRLAQLRRGAGLLRAQAPD